MKSGKLEEIANISLQLSGVSVAVKQVMPDHIIVRTPIGKITNRNIPLSVFGLTFIMWAIGKGFDKTRLTDVLIALTHLFQEWLRAHTAQCLE